MIRLAALLLLLAVPAHATQDQWPALFDVSGVAADDVLNVRAAPSADAEIIGTLAHDAEGVEIVEPNDRHTWGKVNLGEGPGWVSLAYVTRRPGQWAGAQIDSASCVGMEPFWDFTFRDDAVTWTTPEESVAGTLLERVHAIGRIGEQALTFRFEDGQDGVAILRLDQCHDSMSDREYGLSVHIVKGGTDGPALYSGCCNLVP